MVDPAMKKILIVDDEPDHVYIVEEQLRLSGYQTLSASDGQEGLRLAKEIQPALIILDLNLPKLSGLEVCRAIREDRDETFKRTPFSYTPIVMLTGNSGETDRIIGNVLGADDYLVKPFKSDVFLSKVKELFSANRS